MAVRKVVRMGHPVLRQPAQDLTVQQLKSDWFKRLVVDMTDTLHDYGGIGLAAPQIGESCRLALIEIAGGPTRYGEIPTVPLTVFVNPRIEVLDTEEAGYWEGCLSVPGLRGFVSRPQLVRVLYSDIDGEDHAMELSGFLATVFQHEFDHLDGMLYIDRIQDTRLLAFEEEYLRYLEPQASDAAPSDEFTE